MYKSVGIDNVGKIILTFRSVTMACKSAMCRRHFNCIGTGPEIDAMWLQGTHLRLQGSFKLVPIGMTNLDGHPSLGGF